MVWEALKKQAHFHRENSKFLGRRDVHLPPRIERENFKVNYRASYLHRRGACRFIFSRAECSISPSARPAGRLYRAQFSAPRQVTEIIEVRFPITAIGFPRVVARLYDTPVDPQNKFPTRMHIRIFRARSPAGIDVFPVGNFRRGLAPTTERLGAFIVWPAVRHRASADTEITVKRYSSHFPLSLPRGGISSPPRSPLSTERQFWTSLPRPAAELPSLLL